MKIVSNVIIAIMIAFSIYGIIDKLFLGGKKGVGEQFEKGVSMFAPLFISMAGIIALVPVLAYFINSTLSPLYISLGLDPSLAVSSIIAIDMGGYQLSKAVALEPLIGEWAAIMFGTTLGTTIVFSIPVGLSTIKKEDIPSFSKGVLYGLAATPIGCFVGGIILGVPIVAICKNMIIPIMLSLTIILCLRFFPNKTIKVFSIFSKLINIIALLGLALALIKDYILLPICDASLLNISNIPFFNVLGSSEEGIIVAGQICIVLSGALPFIYCISKWLKKPLEKLSHRFNMSNAGITGFLLSSANNIAMFSTLGEMNEKEKVMNVAFAVSSSFIIGDHLAFVAANSANMIVPMIISNLLGGVIAVILVNTLNKND